MNHASRRHARGLVYYMHDGPAAFRFQLAGDLSLDSTADLDQARQTASSALGRRSLLIDLTGVESIDAAGGELLERWHGLGAQLVVTTQHANARIQTMSGLPVRFLEKKSRSLWASGRAALWLLPAACVLLSVLTITILVGGRAQ